MLGAAPAELKTRANSVWNAVAKSPSLQALGLALAGRQVMVNSVPTAEAKNRAAMNVNAVIRAMLRLNSARIAEKSRTKQ